MRKKLMILGIFLCLIFSMTGCGDTKVDTSKRASEEENINDSQEESIIDLSAENTLSTESGTVVGTEENTGSGIGTEGNTESGIVTDMEENMESGAATNSEENTESENVIDTESNTETGDDNDFADNTGQENGIYSASEDNTMLILNLSGVDLYDLSLSFSESMDQQEILGEDKLKDGSYFVYTLENMDSLKNARNLKLGVIGEDKKEEYDFGSISVIDPSNMVLVLTRNQDGYYMYIK